MCLKANCMGRDEWREALVEMGYTYKSETFGESAHYDVFKVKDYVIQLFNDEMLIIYNNTMVISYFYNEINLVGKRIMDGKYSWNHFMLNLNGVSEGENYDS